MNTEALLRTFAFNRTVNVMYALLVIFSVGECARASGFVQAAGANAPRTETVSGAGVAAPLPTATSASSPSVGRVGLPAGGLAGGGAAVFSSSPTEAYDLSDGWFNLRPNISVPSRSSGVWGRQPIALPAPIFKPRIKNLLRTFASGTWG